MSRWIVLLPLLLASPPALGDGPPAQRRARPALVPDLAVARSWSPPEVARASPASTPPPCIGDVCQPRVTIPGREPRFSTQGKRTELFVTLLERSKMEPLATITWYLAATGLRLDLSPARSTPGDPGGGTRAEIGLRWRLDAMNRPVWPSRRRGKS